MTVRITDSWEGITVSSDFPRTPTTRALFYRLSCGCIAKAEQPVLLAVSKHAMARAMNQLAELHRCPKANEPLQLPDTPGDAGRPGG